MPLKSRMNNLWSIQTMEYSTAIKWLKYWFTQKIDGFPKSNVEKPNTMEQYCMILFI